MIGLSILHKHYRLENMEVNSVRVEKASIIPYGFNFNDGIVMQVLKKKKLLFMKGYDYQVKLRNANNIVAVATCPG